MLFTEFWQLDVILIEFCTIFPIYLLILIGIWRKRRGKCWFQGQYYTLVLSQGAVDVLAILTIMSIQLIRYFQIGNQLLFKVPGAASYYANAAPLLFLVRLFGVLLITVQRYVTVCWHASWLDTKIKKNHPMILVIIHYTVPCILYSPAFIVSENEFQDPISLFIITSPLHAKLISIIVSCSFLIVSVIVLVMYLSILRVIFQASNKNSSGRLNHPYRSREIRLAAHVFLLSIMSATVFTYYWMKIGMATVTDSDKIMALRIFYPILTCNFSYINPITLILLNKDVQKMIRIMTGFFRIFQKNKMVAVIPNASSSRFRT
uniref:G_PROTEIN_RECEP_F1_2 domain-containing protein n=2 Tax=Caenorhabditis tropicalis TaxID=1561998 RepID=A0A1I7TH29_9PELO